MQPINFWLSVFHQPQLFLTSVLLNHARLHNVSVDNLTFNFNFTGIEPSQRAPNGEFIYGVYIIGASFSEITNEIEECEPNVLQYKMPIIELIPVEISKKKKKSVYSCPLYKTSSRAG